ncbi:hypothetical protein GmHk_10G028377 [Glycine max]|nr:hypothetical protein GmHk_10G028377 [Glycine max]
MVKFDPEIVMEFYANAWPIEEGVRDKHSWVRGQWILFDEDAINQFLGHPLASGFDEEAISQLLCISGQDFARNVAGRQVWIMRTSMTTLTLIWIINNPCVHPVPKRPVLVYAIMTQVSVHVAQLISDAIYQFARITPSRHPVDPEKSSKALGFPALIMGLCQFYQ